MSNPIASVPTHETSNTQQQAILTPGQQTQQFIGGLRAGMGAGGLIQGEGGGGGGIIAGASTHQIQQMMLMMNSGRAQSHNVSQLITNNYQQHYASVHGGGSVPPNSAYMSSTSTAAESGNNPQQELASYSRPQIQRKRSSMLSHYQQHSTTSVIPQQTIGSSYNSGGTSLMYQHPTSMALADSMQIPFSPKHPPPHHSSSLGPQTLNKAQLSILQQQQQTALMLNHANLLQLATQNGIGAAIGILQRGQAEGQPSSPRNNRASMMMNMTMTANNEAFAQTLKNNSQLIASLGGPQALQNLGGSTLSNLKRVLGASNPFIARNGISTNNAMLAQQHSSGVQSQMRQQTKLSPYPAGSTEDQMYYMQQQTGEVQEDQSEAAEDKISPPPILGSTNSPVKAIRQSNIQSQNSTAASLQSQNTVKKQGGGKTVTTSLQIQQISQGNPQATTAPSKVASERNQSTRTQGSNIGGGGGGISGNQQQQQQFIIITVSNQGGPPNMQSGAPNQKKSISGNSGNSQGNSNSGQDHKDPKQALLMSIQEVVRLVIQRSEDINQLRQVIDLKTKKLKTKYTDSSFFYGLLQREWQRQSVEGYHLNKTANVRVEDKSPLIKTLQKQVKKMLKPFNRKKPIPGGPGNDDYLHSEVHLSEILIAQDCETAASASIQAKLENSSQTIIPTLSQLSTQAMKELQNQALDQNGNVGQPPPQYKELRKRNIRIIQASFKESLVDPQVALSICIQASRQAFFDEILEYFQCAHEIIIAAAPGSIPSNCNIQTENLNYQNLKKVIQKARNQARVQINLSKKLEKVYKVLVEQNTEILKQITCYKELFISKRAQTNREYQSESPLKGSPMKRSLIEASHIGMKFEDRRHSVPQETIEKISPSKIARMSDVDLSTKIGRFEIVGNSDSNMNQSQKIPKGLITQNQTPITSVSDFGIRPLNTTMTNFIMQTPQIKKTGIPIKPPISQIGENGTNIGLSGTPGAILRGASRISKLQPIPTRDPSLTGIKRLQIPPSNQSTNLSVGREGQKTIDTEPVSFELTKNLKKVNQLPSIPQSSIQVGNIEQLVGQNGKISNLSRRGLEPLPYDQYTAEKIGTLNSSEGETQSISPLKRRAKVIISGNGISRVQSSNGEGDLILSSQQPLLKVFHTSTTHILPNGNQILAVDDNESQNSNQTQSRKKVIKATITIPLPKADMGVIKLRNTKNLNHNTQQIDDTLGQGSLLLPYDDDEDEDLDGDFGAGGDGSEEELMESPDISMVREEQQLKTDREYQLSQPALILRKEYNSVNPPPTMNKVTFLSQSTTNINNKYQLSISPTTLKVTPSLIFKTNPTLLLDMSQFPINDRFDSLFSRYFNKKGILAFIVNHRAKVLQRFIRHRMQMKLQAKRLIVKRFRFYVARQQRLHMFATRLFVTVTQKKAVRAIERAYIRYRDRLRSTLSKDQSSSLSTVEVKEHYQANESSIVKIQKFFRKRLAQRFNHGRKIVKRKELHQRIYQQWQKDRYRQQAALEGQLVKEEAQYCIEKQLLDEYVHQLQKVYLGALSQYHQGLTKAVESNFNMRDWIYNGSIKEWTNDKVNVSFKGSQNLNSQGSSVPAPLQYLIDSNRRLLMTEPLQAFEDIQGVSEALTGLLYQDYRTSKRDLLLQMKRKRHSKMISQMTEASSGKVKGIVSGSQGISSVQPQQQVTGSSPLKKATFVKGK